MSVELLPPITIPEPERWEVEEPRPRRLSPVEEEAAALHGLIRGKAGWTAVQYEELGEVGVIGPEERVELIDGEILAMSPQKGLHADDIMYALQALRKRFEPEDHVRCQLPLRSSVHSEPEPDIAVIAGPFEESEGAHPSTALLIAEVSDTTLRFDQREKASLYAAAGVPDYWISDLRNVRLIVFRDPVPDLSARHGFSYRVIKAYGLDEEVAPLARPDRPLKVKDLFPRSLREKKP